ncbi:MULTISPECIES: YeiH family protein [unclassified Oceanobacter]|uniref:YeiH family protein n=2 Tax=Oceanobacter TaxID=196079 RepID=UPI002732A98E|nr:MULTISPECIES: putative sulfate exporter family transporter [unclassified Oceanobacter]MDP2609329.1 putative sulfate exporter family transporter [Oceanobacter sp. 1_MG-2023]MDP2612574.1 putative sulfate exporter family transporter [Oceanobacter sp. 2_MG-2023]
MELYNKETVQQAGINKPLAAILMAVLITLIAVTAGEIAGFNVVQGLGIGALPISILIGMGLAALPLTERLRAIDSAESVHRIAQKTLLQAGIVLFGFQLSLADLAAVGWQAVIADIITISVILPLGIWLGLKILKLPLSLAVLLAIGSAVCGAAAILATVPVLGKYLHDGESQQQQQQSTGLAVTAVALFGTLSVLLYPQIQHWFGLTNAVAGVYIGSTIHEVAQTMAATEAMNAATQHNAVIVKLLRVLMLAPVLLLLALWLQKKNTQNNPATQGQPARHKITVPGFILYFVAVVVLNTLLPYVVGNEWLQQARHIATQASMLFLALAMSALGLNIRWKHLVNAGFKPIILAVCLWLVLVFGGAILFSISQNLALI